MTHQDEHTEINTTPIFKILSTDSVYEISQAQWEEAFDSFLRLLNRQDESIKSRALIVLGRIANCVPESIIEQLLPHIIPLLNNHSSSLVPSTQAAVMFCLGKIACKGERLSALTGESGTLDILLRVVQRSDRRLQNIAVKALRRLILCTKSNQVIFARSGGTEAVIPLIASGPEDLKVPAAEILSSIATLKEVRRALVSLGGIPMLIQSARIGKIASRTRAAHAIGLLGVTRRIRRVLVNAGAISALIDLLREDDLNAKLTAGNSLGILSAHVDYLRLVAQAGAIPLLVELLEGSDLQGKEIAEDVFSILAVAEENAVIIAEHLVRVLGSSNSEAKAAAADVIWDLSSYKHSVSVVRSSGAIPLLVRVLELESDDVREKASGAVAQLSYDQADRIALVEAGAIPVLLSLLESGSEELKDNAAEALINFSEDPASRDLIAEAFDIPAFQSMQARLHRIQQSDEHTARSLRFMGLEQFTS